MDCRVAWFPTVFSLADDNNLLATDGNLQITCYRGFKPLATFPGTLLCETDLMQAASAFPRTTEDPPWLGTWPNVYRAVLIYLALLITTLYLISAHFTY
jgi:hypothetical protein